MACSEAGVEPPLSLGGEVEHATHALEDLAVVLAMEITAPDDGGEPVSSPEYS